MKIILPSQPRKAAWYFLLAYWIVTVLGILLTIAFAAIFHPPSPQELGVPLTQAPAYLMTLPYHPLLNLFWFPFAWMYLRGFAADSRQSEAFKLGTFWAVICILIDLVGWILIPHPWAMTFKEFYVDYQPWITLIYLVIFASPIVIAYFQKKAWHNGAGKKGEKMKFPAWYGISVGALIILQWTFFIITGAVPEFRTTPWAIGFHNAAELLLALALLIGGIATLQLKSWGKNALLVALGMAIYSEINSPGYFAQLGQWPLVAMFAVLLFGAVWSVMLLLSKDRIGAVH